MKIIQQFSGRFRFLSNFYPCWIRYKGITYPSLEHAYQAAKTSKHSDKIAIRNCATPGQTKCLSRQLPYKPDWDKRKLVIMELLLRLKFQQPTFHRLLLITRGFKLVEGNTWGDRYWGVDGVGENMLGKLLMKIRDENH